MLTYCVYAALLNLIDALPLNAIYDFETASKSNRFKGSEPNKGSVASQSKIHYYFLNKAVAVGQLQIRGVKDRTIQTSV